MSDSEGHLIPLRPIWNQVLDRETGELVWVDARPIGVRRCRECGHPSIFRGVDGRCWAITAARLTRIGPAAVADICGCVGCSHG